MSSSSNTELNIVTSCEYCAAGIELVPLVSEDSGRVFLYWRHVASGFFSCLLTGAPLAAFNVATPVAPPVSPDWTVH